MPSEMALLWTVETGIVGEVGSPESVVPLTCAGVFIGPVSSQCQHQPTASPSHSLGSEMSTTNGTCAAAMHLTLDPKQLLEKPRLAWKAMRRQELVWILLYQYLESCPDRQRP